MEIRVAKTTLLAVSLVIAGVILRLVPHAANFAPVGAIALFAGAVVTRRLALWLPLAVMVASDVVLGLYPSIWFTWGAFALIVGYGMLWRNRTNWLRVPLGAIGSSFIFFVVSNFGVWFQGGLYPHTWQGLADCYTLALPFARNTLLSDLGYSVVLFGLYAYSAPKIKGHVVMPLKRLSPIPVKERN